MKIQKQLLIAFALCVGCVDHDTSDCIIRETLVDYPGTTRQVTEKRLYFYEGNELSEIHSFYPSSDGTFSETPTSIEIYTYHQGRIAEEITKAPNSPHYSKKYEYTYVEGEITTVNIHETEMNLDGVVFAENNYSTHFIESPRDETYLTTNQIGEEILEVYEGGNLTKVGFKSPTGSYNAYGATWYFPLHYKYDNQPNVAKNNVAIRQLIYAPNGGFCRNNMIEEIGGAESSAPWSRKNSFQQQGQMLKKWIYESTGRTVSVNYECR